MGRTDTRQHRQRRTSGFDDVNRPLHEKLEGAETEKEEVGFSGKKVENHGADDQEMSQAGDSGSIPTTMGVRVSFKDKQDGLEATEGYPYSYFHSALRRVPSKEFQQFVIPQTPLQIAAAAAADDAQSNFAGMQQDDNEDDISVLTESSGMEEEEDASSQITTGTEARTIVTNTTGSTTVPTKNLGGMGTLSASSQQQQQRLSKRRNSAVDKMNGFHAFDDSQYKRRRMR